MAFSAVSLIAWPPFEISWPTPATVLQPASAAVTTSSIAAIVRVILILLRINKPDGRIVCGAVPGKTPGTGPDLIIRRRPRRATTNPPHVTWATQPVRADFP
ncbi:hypothetical protein BCEP27_90139 [Burkholderia cepacia]